MVRGRFAALFRRGDRDRDRSSSSCTAMGRSSSSSTAASLRQVFGESTLRDTVAPLLVPCYDLSTGAPFLFSRADAMETDSFDFHLRDVCEREAAGAGKGGGVAGGEAAGAVSGAGEARRQLAGAVGGEVLQGSGAAVERQRERREEIDDVA